MPLKDAVEFLVNLLNDSWNKANTDNRKPIIKKIVKVKRIPEDSLDLDREDYLLLYLTATNFQNITIGNGKRNINHLVSVDARSTWSSVDVDGDVHKERIKAEVDRILNENVLPNPITTGFNIIDPDQGLKDLSNRSTGLFRFTYDAEVQQHVVER